MDDHQLTRLAADFRSGDRDSFRGLVEAMSRTLIAVAYRYTQDWEASRDLSQETWIKVYQRIESYDPDRPFRAWLLSVHRNGCLSHLRTQATRPERLLPDAELVRLERPAANPDPLAEIQGKEFGERLRRALAGLTDSQRRVFSLVGIEQIPQEEAARLLNMKSSTLRTTLHFARKRLAARLRESEA